MLRSVEGNFGDKGCLVEGTFCERRNSAFKEACREGGEGGAAVPTNIHNENHIDILRDHISEEVVQPVVSERVGASDVLQVTPKEGLIRGSGVRLAIPYHHPIPPPRGRGKMGCRGRGAPPLLLKRCGGGRGGGGGCRCQGRGGQRRSSHIKRGWARLWHAPWRALGSSASFFCFVRRSVNAPRLRATTMTGGCKLSYDTRQWCYSQRCEGGRQLLDRGFRNELWADTRLIGGRGGHLAAMVPLPRPLAS